MKKLTLLLVLFMPFLTFGQNEPLISYDDSTKTLFHNSGRFKSHINLEFASSANAYFTEGAFDELSFKMNRVRLEILGRLNDNLSYHFRQSFNKYSNPYSVDNMSSSIEYAYIKWHHEDKFELVAGKFHRFALAGSKSGGAQLTLGIFFIRRNQIHRKHHPALLR